MIRMTHRDDDLPSCRLIFSRGILGSSICSKIPTTSVLGPTRLGPKVPIIGTLEGQFVALRWSLSTHVPSALDHDFRTISAFGFGASCGSRPQSHLPPVFASPQTHHRRPHRMGWIRPLYDASLFVRACPYDADRPCWHDFFLPV